MSHEKEYLKKVAADPNVKDFGAEELAEIEKAEKAGPVDPMCVIKCYAEYRLCREGGGSATECRAKLAICLTTCKV